jgi:hypothetical protein
VSTVKKANDLGELPMAKLTQKDNKLKVVEFQFNPNKITIGHSPQTKAIDRTMGVVEEQEQPGAQQQAQIVVASGDVLTQLGDTTIGFDKMILDGGDVLDKCKLLLAWTYPVKQPATGTNKAGDLVVPELEFSWGAFDLGMPFKPICVVLTKVDVEYSRFTQQGTATRAVATISCKVKVYTMPGQNPTSGGQPGRSGHRMIEGQNIQGIARHRYGDPKRWRELAEANGIDDPLRVRPGDMLYLPSQAELGRSPR